MTHKIIHNDCLIAMKEMKDNSIDFIVCDPPYALNFMGKKWDDKIPSIEIWQEALRICKPGAMLAAFGGSRTHHHLMIAIESAGWEIRDCIMWLYGSGFPKSHNISKAIDKHGGHSFYWFGSWLREEREKRNIKQNEISALFPSKSGRLTGCVANWELGLNLPSPEQFNKICDFLNVDFERRLECEREIVGIGKSGKTAIWQDKGMGEFNITKSSSSLAKTFDSYGTSLKPAYEPIIIAMKPVDGTFAKNAEKWGVGGINIDSSRIGIKGATKRTNQADYPKNEDGTEDRSINWARVGHDIEKLNKGRWPSNLILDEESAEQLDKMTGHLAGAGNKIGSLRKQNSSFAPNQSQTNFKYDSGGRPSRFFYCAKSSSSERNKGLDKPCSHPTVKPISLMKYIITLLAPPGNPICLDPFMGSGSTGVACKELGISFIGIEKEKEYVEIATKRLDTAQYTSQKQMEMFNGME